MLSSDRLGVIAKLDLAEKTGNVVTPIDYKRGRPRRGTDGELGAWLPERVQICLQALIAARDDRKPLYLNTQGLTVGHNGEVLRIKEQDRIVQEVRLRETNQVNLLGSIQMSSQAI